MGTPTRTRKQLVDLPVSVTMQPPPTDCAEVDRKMKEIMKMNGLLTINGRVSTFKLFNFIKLYSYEMV